MKKRQSRILINLHLLFYVLLAITPNFVKAEQINLAMDVALEKEESNFFLKVRLENRGEKEIKIYEHYLPWMTSDNMRIFLINATKRYEYTEQMFTIDDPGVDVAVIEPKKYVEGKVYLSNYFPALDLNGDEILFFWTYLLEPKDEKQESKRFGGFCTTANLGQ